MTCSIRSLEERKRRNLRATGCMEGMSLQKRRQVCGWCALSPLPLYRMLRADPRRSAKADFCESSRFGGSIVARQPRCTMTDEALFASAGDLAFNWGGTSLRSVSEYGCNGTEADSWQVCKIILRISTTCE